MLTIKRPSLRSKRTAQKSKKTRLKTCLQRGSLFALAAVQGALHTGWNPGELITSTDKIGDIRLKGQGWEKYKVRGDGFSIHYMVNTTNPNDKLYTDLKAKDHESKKR